tara:strand:- start:1242 stop:2237 length:996 start_codon:yes stop_codon:yes gene_type:complete
MKIGDFVNEPKSKPVIPPTVIGDVEAEKALKDELDRFKIIEAERDMWKTRGELAEGDLEEEKTTSKQLGNEVTKLTREVTNLEGLNGELKRGATAHLETRVDLEKWQSDYADLEANYASLKSQNETAQTSLQEVQTEKTNLENEADTIRKSLSLLRAENASLIERNDELTSSEEDVYEQSQINKTKARELEEAGQELKIEISTMTTQLEFYKELKNKFDETIKEAQDELEVTRENLTERRARTTSLVAAVAQGEQDLDEAQLLHEEMNRSINILEVQLGLIRKKADMPVYMSTSMIEKMEGFKMPSGMVPIRNGLGLGKPTLFRKAAVENE